MPHHLSLLLFLLLVASTVGTQCDLTPTRDDLNASAVCPREEASRWRWLHFAFSPIAERPPVRRRPPLCRVHWMDDWKDAAALMDECMMENIPCLFVPINNNDVTRVTLIPKAHQLQILLEH